MSKSPKITIKSAALREAVENKLNRWITDTEWEICERQARAKVERLREMNPDVDYYDNRYLMIVAAEIFSQNSQINDINVDARIKIEKRKYEGNEEVRDSQCAYSGRPCIGCGRCRPIPADASVKQ